MRWDVAARRSAARRAKANDGYCACGPTPYHVTEIRCYCGVSGHIQYCELCRHAKRGHTMSRIVAECPARHAALRRKEIKLVP